MMCVWARFLLKENKVVTEHVMKRTLETTEETRLCRDAVGWVGTA